MKHEQDYEVGIYAKRRRVHLTRSNIDALRPHAAHHNITERLDDDQARLEAFIRDAGHDPKRPTGTEPEDVQDAAAALASIKCLRGAIKDNNAGNAAVHAIDLGRALERLQVRPFEPLVRTGRKIKRAASAGHQAVHGTADQRQATYIRWRELVQNLRAGNPALSRTRACELIAEDEHVHWRTIYDHTK